jgi:hypothetical protein
VGSQDNRGAAPPAGVEEVLRIATTIYRRRGPAQVGLPLAAFGDGAAQARALLESGELEPHERGVALAPSVRLALAGPSVLAEWLDEARAITGPTARPALDAIRGELRTITRWACGKDLPDQLTQRAAELAGVLATSTLDPEAMAVVAASGGEPRRRLLQLCALPEGGCQTLKELRTEISRFVSTIRREP